MFCFLTLSPVWISHSCLQVTKTFNTTILSKLNYIMNRLNLRQNRGSRPDGVFSKDASEESSDAAVLVQRILLSVVLLSLTNKWSDCEI